MGNLTQKGKCVPWKGQWHWQTRKSVYIHICIYRHLYRSLLSQSSGIQAHSAGFQFHSTGFRFHSTGFLWIPVESGGIDAFLQESVGHQKVQGPGSHWGNNFKQKLDSCTYSYHSKKRCEPIPRAIRLFYKLSNRNYEIRYYEWQPNLCVLWFIVIWTFLPQAKSGK